MIIIKEAQDVSRKAKERIVIVNKRQNVLTKCIASLNIEAEGNRDFTLPTKTNYFRETKMGKKIHESFRCCARKIRE